MAFDSGSQLARQTFFKPHVEVELAFVMKDDLRQPGLSIFDVLQATAFVQPALELIDYRTVKPRPIADMVADNTACAGAILGGRPVSPAEIDLHWVAATLSRNGQIEKTGVSAAVLGHPVNGIIALAEALATVGLLIKAGDVILSGSFTRMLEVDSGDWIVADHGTLGTIEAMIS